MKIFNYLAVMCAVLLLISACSTTKDPSEAYKGESAEQIFQKGEEALRKKDYKETVKRFEALDAQYPFGANTEKAQLHIIYAYYMSGDYASAIAAADRFVHVHPTDPHVDYAYLMKGLANYNLTMGVFERVFPTDFAKRDLSQIRKSYADFSELVHRFPQSKYAPTARQYMVYMRNILARHQLEVAQYYFTRKAYIGAADRANDVVRHYQGSPVVPDALVVMIKSYRALNLPELANQSQLVLEYNYPNSKYLQELTK